MPCAVAQGTMALFSSLHCSVTGGSSVVEEALEARAADQIS